MKKTILISLCCGAAIWCAAADTAKPADPKQEALTALLAKGQKTPDTLSADEMSQLLRLSSEAGRAASVSPVIKAYLSKHTDVAPALLKLAAENAALVGDYRVAVARYKQLMKIAVPGAETSEASADLYRILIDYTAQPDVAYQFMAENGDKIRSAEGPHPYDGWFLDRCFEQKATVPMVKWLALILADQMPLEQERLYYWSQLDRCLDRLTMAGPNEAAAIVPARRLAGVIRGDATRAARAKFLAENLAFRASAAGKEQAALDKDFGTVIAAAQAYVDAAPTAPTVKDIFTVFCGGLETPSDTVWAMQLPQKQAFFESYAFEKLPDADRLQVMAWTWKDANKRLMTPRQWAAAGGRHVELFQKSPSRAVLPFVSISSNPADYKAEAQFLQGAVSRDAAAINSLAASDDLNGAIKNLVAKESWYLAADTLADVIATTLVPAYRLWPRGDAEPLAANYAEPIQTQFGRDYLLKSPLAALSVESARNYLVYAWRWSGATPEDKSKFVECLHLVDWVPYSKEDRRKVFELARGEFKAWGDETRRLYEAARRSNNTNALSGLAARVASIGPIEEAFKQVTDPEWGDPAKAPDPVCKDLARTMLAIRQKNRDAYLEAGRSLYQAVRDYEMKKTPHGEALLSFLTTSRPALDSFDLQSEILADQVALCLSQGVRRGMTTAIWNIRNGRPIDQERMQRTRLNGILLKAVDELASADKFDPELFTLYLGAKLNEQADLNLISKLIDRRLFYKNAAARYIHSSATCSYMALIRNEFPTLASKYPLENAFDDLFIEEIRKSGVVDTAYWAYGRDEQRKVANTVAGLLSQSGPLPVGYGDGPSVYTASQYWEIVGRSMAAEAGVRDAMLAKMESGYGTSRFDETAAGRLSLFYMSITTPELRKQFFEKLARYTERSAASPVPMAIPYLPQIVLLEQAKNLTDDEFEVLARVFSRCWWRPLASDVVIDRLIGIVHDGLVARGRASDLTAMAPVFWRIARELGSAPLQDKLTAYAAALAAKGQPDLAAACSSVGLEIMGGRVKEDTRTTLKAVRSKALLSVGGTIMVDRSDRRYPLFAAQAFYEAGKLDSAWEQYRSAKDVALTEFKELDIEFLTWLVERHIELGEYESADALVQRLIEWVDSTPQGFDLEARIRLLLAHASIAFARQEYPSAQAQYQRITVTREFEGTQGAILAEMKLAEIDRLTKHYDAAAERLEKLRRHPDPALQAECSYQLALIKFDQEDYASARDFVNLVFAQNMSHANARILEGKLNLKTKKLVEATEVRVGLATDRNTIIPGRTLKIQIEDRNLAVVGKMANVEVRVWTDSGDEEFLNLLPFGDSKTKFEGELQTALAPQAKGDRVLQVLGRDKVHYAFSEAFKKAAGVVEDNMTTIDVISDAELYISSGRILSKEEQEDRALQRTLEAQARKGEGGTEVLSDVRADDEIKPGNPIYVRVVDPDRSVTAGKDQISLRAVTTSGDSVDNLVLQETETHSGVFEGKIDTATAPATAFASDSEEGKEPSFAISSGNYPPWVGLADNRRPKTFSVDLNNNVLLNQMSIVADVPGRLLKKFIVQTSMNGRDYTTVGAWPTTIPDWDGYLRCRLVRYSTRDGGPASLNELKQYLDLDYLAQGNEMVYLPGMVSGRIGTDVMGQADRLKIGTSGVGSWYIAHFQGVFYVAERRMRTFRIETPNKAGRMTFNLAIDGQMGKKATEIALPLEKGLHQYDLYISGQRRTDPEFELQYDIPEAPYMARCPTAMFAPATRPPTAPVFRSNIAQIQADATSNTFTVAFGSNTSARLLRIGIADFEGDAPAIRRLNLTSADGQQVLPAKENVLALRRNNTLEIVPGDRISVIYEDPSVVSKDRQVLEAFMKATFYNATIRACYAESSVDSTGTRHAQYIPLRRFRAGDPISVLINDPDGDVSEAQDKVKFTVKVARGQPLTLEALESARHSGLFIGKFFAVTGEPKRPAELKVAPGEDVVISYLDDQNTDYGIPWYRTCQVEQAVPSEPEIRVYEYASRLLDASERKLDADRSDIKTGEVTPVTRTIVASRPDAVKTDGVTTNLIGCPIIVELRYPTIALSPLSTATLYVQAAPAAEGAGKAAPVAFDPSLPGTLKYECAPGDVGAVTPPPGYREVLVRGNPYAVDALEDGHFTLVIPARLGDPGEGGAPAGVGSATAATEASDSEEGSQTLNVSSVSEDGKPKQITRRLAQPTLLIHPDDAITVAYEVSPATTNQPARWLTQSVVLTADAFFDAMDQRYQQPLRNVHVGERVYVRVTDPLRDTAMGKDTVTATVPLASGVTQSLSLVETFVHSGVFKGSFLTVYSGTVSNKTQPDVVAVNYGEALKLRYQPGGNSAPLLCTVQMHKGADGAVHPFTKRFQDPEVAVQTQFTTAEAFFELAKKHRELKQEDLARREIAQGKKLLEEALHDYPETEERAHADYLLANLAMEYAEEIENPEQKKQRYLEAISRFSDIVSSYAASPYAPKSQFKKALAFEKLGQLDQACEEYVKLSYRYPDNELVAETIARLGQYFMTKGKEFQDKMNAVTDAVQKEKARRQMCDMYKTAAQVFARLSARFPEHQLAGKTLVLSAQCWIRAEDLDKAISVFTAVIDAKKAGNDLIAQSMYWNGDCYMKKKDYVNAYRMFKRLTWDYPETTWAKYARGRLTDPELVNVETKEEGGK